MRPDNAHLVDLIVLHDALHVVARLGEGDPFDPVDTASISLAARIAEALDPFSARFGPAL